MMLSIQNRGADIVSTNFWTLGIPFVAVSLNAGAYRVLLPCGLEHIIDEIRSATSVVIRRGPLQRQDTMEILFDDGSDAPFAIYTGVAAFVNGVPADSEVGRARILTIWTGDDERQPTRRLDLPCHYLGRVASLPSVVQ